MKRSLTVLAVAAPLLLVAALVLAVMQNRDEPEVAGLTSGYVSPLTDVPSAASVSSDTFGGTALESLWTPVDIATDDSIEVGSGTVQLRSSSATAREAWGVLDRPRIAQAVDNEDFVVDVRFLQVPNVAGQRAGLTFEADSRNWAGFEMEFDGQLRLNAVQTSDGQSSVRLVENVSGPVDSMILRAARRGPTWSFEYSVDGTIFRPIGTFEFALDLAQIAIGAGAVEGPASTVDGEVMPPSVPEAFFEVTSFTNTAETGLGGLSGPGVEINVVGPGSFTVSPPLSDIQDGDTLTIEAVAEENASFDGWEGTGTADGSTYRVVIEDGTEVTLNFEDLLPLPQFDIWYGNDQTFGADGRAQTWINLLGNVDDRDGIAEFTFTLNDQPPSPLTVGPDGRRLAEPGDFNAEIAFEDLQPGINTVVLEATDSLGNTSTEVINVNLEDNDDPLTDRTITWDEDESPADQVQIPDGKWEIRDGELVTVEPDYDRVFLLGQEDWANYEVEVEVTPRELDVNAYQENSGSPSIYLVGGWRGHVDWTGLQPRTGYWPLGAFALWVWPPEQQLQLTGNERDAEATLPRLPPQLGTTYIFKMRSEEVTAGVEYSFKVFAKGTAEPSDWDLSIVDQSGPRSGSILIAAHHVDAAFGEINIEAL